MKKENPSITTLFKKTIAFLFKTKSGLIVSLSFLFIMALIFMVAISPEFYIFFFLPIILGCYIIYKANEENLKLAKNFNDVFLFSLAAIKAATIASQTASSDFAKDLMMNFQQPDVSLKLTILFVFSSFFKALLSIRELHSNLKENKLPEVSQPSQENDSQECLENPEKKPQSDHELKE